MKLSFLSSALAATTIIGSSAVTAQAQQTHYKTNLPSGQVSPPASRGGLETQILSTLDRMTGFNITGAYSRAKTSQTFDRARDEKDGFVRLTDENYDRLVRHEHLEDEAEQERVWFSIIHAPPTDPTSNLFLDAMTNASIIARSNTTDPLNHIKWARIDFITEIELAAKWLVFKPPVLVIATNHSTSLRFLTTRMIPPNATLIERVMREEQWRDLPVWESVYAPGGSREFLVDWYVGMTKSWNKITTTVPSWALLIIMPMLTQQFMSLLHSSKRGGGGK